MKSVLNGDIKKLAIIGSGEMAVIIAENARKMGVYTYSFSNDATDKVVGHSDEHILISIFDTKKIIDFCKKVVVDGVISTTELTIGITAIVADALKLHGMPVGLSEKVTNKSFVREKAKGLSTIKQPEFFTVDCKNLYFVKPKKYPVIIKPVALGGKRGITVVYSEDELKNALSYAGTFMKSDQDCIIVEEYIALGKEYSVESLSYEGKHQVIQVTEKITSGPPHCVELGHIQPARISNKERRKIEDAIPQLLATVGLNNTTSHTEIKIVDGEIYLIELNSRSGGDHISYPLTELSTGYPFIIGAIHIALGDFVFPQLKETESRTAGVLFVVKQTEYLKKLFDECEKYSWLFKKNEISKEYNAIRQNNAFETNYFIFVNDNGLPKEIEEILVK